ncbi:MAG TPA: plasmid pRiA4b ORF-3 family protein [Gammaproteobacteria bacterium]|nr:plasmid pRiA4b ORF-3 family protein [Gammaproteobacteria bacterium]
MTLRPVFQFKIALQGIWPLVWRRIQISDLCTFWDLHVAIQDSMGWEDYHLHQFDVINFRTNEKERVGIPDDEWLDEVETLPGWDLRVRDYVLNSEVNQRIPYLYDFGDHWEHIIEFEGKQEKLPGKKYPICLAGERACPPEDVGSIRGYTHYLEVIMDPTHEEYTDMLAWRGKYHPAKFDPKKVKFDNPRKRWIKAFLEE